MSSTKRGVKKAVKRPAKRVAKKTSAKVAPKAKKRAKAPEIVCNCPLDHPFRWKETPRPSIFAADPAFKAKLSQISTENVDRQRAEGKSPGSIRGISRNREAEALRMRQFSIYSLAKKP